jgi:hypothetical protein
MHSVIRPIGAVPAPEASAATAARCSALEDDWLHSRPIFAVLDSRGDEAKYQILVQETSRWAAGGRGRFSTQNRVTPPEIAYLRFVKYPFPCTGNDILGFGLESFSSVNRHKNYTKIGRKQFGVL